MYNHVTHAPEVSHYDYSSSKYRNYLIIEYNIWNKYNCRFINKVNQNNILILNLNTSIIYSGYVSTPE